MAKKKLIDITEKQIKAIYDSGKKATVSFIRMLVDKINDINEIVLIQQEEINKLKAIINKNSHNSNKPPSSDNPFKNKTKSLRKKGGKVGGQKNHKGTTLKQTEKPDKVIPCKIEGNCSCGKSLKDAKIVAIFGADDNVVTVEERNGVLDLASYPISLGVVLVGYDIGLAGAVVVHVRAVIVIVVIVDPREDVLLVFEGVIVLQRQKTLLVGCIGARFVEQHPVRSGRDPFISLSMPALEREIPIGYLGEETDDIVGVAFLSYAVVSFRIVEFLVIELLLTLAVVVGSRQEHLDTVREFITVTQPTFVGL